MSRRIYNNLLACIALLLGCVLYVCFRPNSRIAVLISSFPAISNFLQRFSFNLQVFHFPDFLWAFSFCCLLNSIYLSNKTGTFLCGIGAFSAGVLWEVLQWVQFVSGTGDLLDILAYLLAATLSTTINLGGRDHEKT